MREAAATLLWLVLMTGNQQPAPSAASEAAAVPPVPVPPAALDAPALGRLARFDIVPTSGAAPGYVPDAVCANCHAALAESYREVGMARSMFRPRVATDIEDFTAGSFVHTPSRQKLELSRVARAGRAGGPSRPAAGAPADPTAAAVAAGNGRAGAPALLFRRTQLDERGQPSHVFEREVDWVLGSGNHARVYLYQEPGGEIFQLPIAWYTQERRFGMAPGFDRADHDGVRRRVRRECLFCHNGYPEVPAGSDAIDAPQTFPAHLPEGTGCQRCHGPGALHVATAVGGERDTARLAATIVNPARLEPARRDDVCLQCHLQPAVALPGVRRLGRGDYSFRPGANLAEYLVQVDADEEGRAAADRFEINHHPYRLRQSACYLRSGDRLSCLTCHDPHRRAPAAERPAHFRAACLSCHGAGGHPGTPCSRPERSQLAPTAVAGPDTGDCATCHMPKRRTEDVVHVVMTDHRIGRPTGGDPMAPRAEHDPVLVGVRLYDPAHAPTGDEGELYRVLAVLRSNASPEALARAETLLARLPSLPAEGAFALAEAQLQRRQYAAAEKTANLLLARAPGRPLALEWRALAVAGQGRSDAAVADLRAAVAAGGERSELRYNLGRLLQQSGHLEQAIPELERAIALRPSFAEAWRALGHAQKALGREAAAAASFARALSIEPRLTGVPAVQ